MSNALNSPHSGSSLEDFHREQMKNPEFREEYERLQLQRKVAQLIASKRKEKQLSQAELAERVHTKQAVISRIESGNVSVGLQMLQRIATALETKVDIALS